MEAGVGGEGKSRCRGGSGVRIHERAFKRRERGEEWGRGGEEARRRQGEE